MSKFKAGDLVVYTGTETPEWRGKTGTIASLWNGGIGAQVRFDGEAGECACVLRNLSLRDDWSCSITKAAWSDMSSRVEALEQLAHGHKAEAEVDPNAEYVRQQEKISVGDRVRYVGQNHEWAGKLATVTAIYPEQEYPYRIVMDGSWGSAVSNQEQL